MWHDSATQSELTPRTLNQRVSRWLRTYYNAPDHLAKLRLWRWMRRSTGFRRLTIPYSSNGSISIDERDYLQNSILATGDYEPEVWDALSCFITSKEVFWDVGANIGSVSIKALLHPGVDEVHAFEPDPIHADILKCNLELNSGTWYLHRLALSDLREQRDLRHAVFPHTGGSTLESNPLYDSFHGSYRVECWPADQLISEKAMIPPTIIKVDIEGWELNFFRGAKRMLSHFPPKAIVVELDSNSKGRLVNTEVATELQGLGYSLQWIPRPEGIVYHRENYLAVPD